jgi:hypothetical protein
MIWIALLLADLYLFFIMYVASMGMVRAHAEGKLNGVLWVLCLPFVLIALIVDVLHNVTVFWLLFWEMPKEFTVTARLKKHVTANNWRGSIARWLGLTLLNPFDYTNDHLD